MRKLSDTEIVAFLQSSNGKQQDLALTFLHRQVNQQVMSFVINKKGNRPDAEDVLQEGLAVFFKMARNRKLPEEVNAAAYLMTICKNIWFRSFRKKLDTVNISELEQVADLEDITLRKTLEDEKPLLLKILQERIGDSCYQMLIYFYYEGKKMREIAQLFAYESEQVAKNKKANCMKHLRILIQQEPTLVKAFQ